MTIKVFGNTIETKSNPIIHVKKCKKCGLEKRADVIGKCAKCHGSKFESSDITLDQLAKETSSQNNLTQAKLLCFGKNLGNIQEQIINMKQDKAV